jgi:hypothetical protein
LAGHSPWGVLDWIQWPRSFLLLVVAPGLILVAMEWLARRQRASSAPIEAPA